MKMQTTMPTISKAKVAENCYQVTSYRPIGSARIPEYQILAHFLLFRLSKCQIRFTHSSAYADYYTVIIRG
jgi:hypothetical protein